jgi:hypothetical protein
MASGNIVADGLYPSELGEGGFLGSVDLSLTMSTGNRASVVVQRSYDNGVTWANLVGGGPIDDSFDGLLLAGSASTLYRLKATGVVGVIPYFLGN